MPTSVSVRRRRPRRLALGLVAMAAVVSSVAFGSAPPATAAARGLRPLTTVSEDGPSGMNLTAALSSYGGGSADVTVAYVEGGINWHLSDASTLAGDVAVNWHETPVPCSGATVATATMVVGGVTEPCATLYSSAEADYDTNHDGRVTAADWAGDPRVTDANGNGVLDPEDLISSFCGAGYSPPEDPPGYQCAISGWDFYDNQDDPATVDTAYSHANDQMDQIHHECPNCTILPVKAGDEALDTTDDLAKAWLFAAQAGAKVIVSVTADLGYSTFMRDVISYCESQGIVMVEASNDFDSTDHQGGMFWPYVLAGNGAVATPAKTAWVRSDLTSWGTKTTFTVATGGGSTSESTPTLGGILALLLSYGETAYADGDIASPLTGPQAVQLLRATATPFTDPTLAWPGGGGSSDGWNLQYGYGMPDVDAAATSLFAGQVPPQTTIDSPDWYDLVDPTTTASVPVTGTIATSNPADPFTWTLEAAPGAEPADADWFTIGSGSGTGSYSGNLGTLETSSIPESFWSAPMSVTDAPGDKTLDSSEQYTVTLRLLVSDTGNGTTGEDRRAISVEHDPTALPGFPLYVGPSVDGSPSLVDLQGTGHLDIVFGDADGYIDAIDPATGSELPGWPVHTDPVTVADPEPGVDPGYEPVLAPVAVGDLGHDGKLSVVASSLDGRVYVFGANGQLATGWPQVLDQGVVPPAIPRPQLPHVRLPVVGASSSPVLYQIGPQGRLDIAQAGWDGYLHVWTASGTPVAGWPVKVGLPASYQPPQGQILEEDQKLDTAPAVARFTLAGTPALVIRSQETVISGSGVQPLTTAFVFAFHANGTPVTGWPAALTGLAEDYGSAMEELTEGTDTPVAADVTGTGTDSVTVNPLWTPPVVLNGRGKELGAYGSQSAAISSLLAVVQDPSLALDPGSLPAETAVPFAGSGSFGTLGPAGSPLTYGQADIGTSTFVGALLETDSGLGIDGLEAAYPADQYAGGAPLESGFPATRQGLDLFGQPLFAGVSADGDSDMIDAGDSGALEAYGADGAEVPGFPKFTDGWVTFTPAVGDLLSTGTDDVVTGTREGYLFAWSTPGAATTGAGRWWRFGHDDWNTGNAGTDSQPPGVARDALWPKGTTQATFVAPGSDWYDGTVDHYTVTFQPGDTTETVAPSGPAGTVQTLTVPTGTRSIRIVAVDASGNVSAPVTVKPTQSSSSRAT